MYAYGIPSGARLVSTAFSLPLPSKSDDELEAEHAANRQRREAGRAEREIDPSRRHISPSGVQVDGAGRVWVLTQRYTADHSVFDVLDSGGDFLGEITAETPIVSNLNQVTPFVIAGDRLAAMATLSDGSTRIDVYRIVER